MHARLGALGGLGEIDGEGGVQVLAGGGLAEVLGLELRAGTARAAKHVAQDVFKAATATTSAAGSAPALETVGTEAETFELSAARALPEAAAWLGAEAFIALEAR